MFNALFLFSCGVLVGNIGLLGILLPISLYTLSTIRGTIYYLIRNGTEIQKLYIK